jgi:hypothetical protein
VTPSGEGLAIFETGLAIAYLFAHHFHGNMPIILFVGKNTMGCVPSGASVPEKCRGKGGEEDMVVLFLAASAFDIFTGEIPSLLVQSGIFRFGLQQLAYPAQGAQAGPGRELNLLLKGTNALVFLVSGGGRCNRPSFVGRAIAPKWWGRKTCWTVSVLSTKFQD